MSGNNHHGRPINGRTDHGGRVIGVRLSANDHRNDEDTELTIDGITTWMTRGPRGTHLHLVTTEPDGAELDRTAALPLRHRIDTAIAGM